MKDFFSILILPMALCGAAVFSLNTSLADILHEDDVIIKRSLAIGFDAVTGEDFGYDTIRLKENNLRIHFDDTSTAASYPKNDWRILANSRSNGGDSYFRIEDATAGRVVFQIDAGARNDSLVIDSAGDVGLGTANPYQDLHIVTGSSPAIRLEQNGSAGWDPQTWDISGNESNFFIRDATHMSKLPFRIIPGAESNSLLVSAVGNIGNLAGTAPDAPIHVKRSAAGSTARIHVEDTGGSGAETLLELENNGPCRISQTDTATGTTWLTNVTEADGNGEWRLSESSTGDVEFTVTESGDVEITGNFISNGRTLNVPDFVFEKDYPLMPLTELEEFVGRQKHLPDIPSAEKVKDEGLNLTDLQLKLLQKVEELTLYTLQQEKRIADLAGDSVRQKKWIADLTKRLASIENPGSTTTRSAR